MANRVDKSEFLDEEKFDAIVVGTGITESVAAAALARSGKRVLHLDALPYYGGTHATHSLAAFKEWLTTLTSDGSGADVAESGQAKERGWNTPAEVEGAAVEHAILIAQGRKIENDAMNRPVILDGVDRGHWPISDALQLKSSPSCFTEISFLEELPACRPASQRDDNVVAESRSVEDSTVPVDGEDGQVPDSTAASLAHDRAHGNDGTSEAKEAAEGQDQKEGWEEIIKNGRDYNLDFTPKLNLSSGPLVQALLQSGVGRYLEFMPLQKTFTYVRDKEGMGSLEKVPMSKGEIFQSKSISPMEKRMLMKFLQQCVTSAGIAEAKQGGWAIEGIGGSEQEQLGFKKAIGHVEGGMGHDSKAASSGTGWELDNLATNTLGSLMRGSKLTAKASDFIAHGIAMMSKESSALDAVSRIQLYAKSIGRYSDSAFLACYYGTAEVPQGFCRMSAVYGGLYVLRRTAAYVLCNQEDGRCQGIVCNKGQRLSAPVVICSSSYFSGGTVPSLKAVEATVRKCVCITSGPLPNMEGISLAVLPPGTCSNSTCIRVLQLDWTAQACPRDKFVWHVWAEEAGECDLRAAVHVLHEMAGTVTIHWSAFYSQPVWVNVESGQQVTTPAEAKPGLWIVPPPSTDVDSGDAIIAGENIFRTVCGAEAEFLEAMPEPEVVEEMLEEPVGVDLSQPLTSSEGEGWATDAESSDPVADPQNSQAT